MLAGSIFAFSMGVGAIGKRIENRTIAPLLTSRLPRGGVYLTQFFANTVFFVVTGTLLCSVALVVMSNLLKYQESISTGYFVGLFVGSSLLFIAFSALGQLVGMVLNGERATQIGAGIVVVSWFITSLGEFAHIPAMAQKLSLFGYFDVTLLRDSHVLSGSLTTVLVILVLAFVGIGYVFFRKKNIYL
jgi:ABC-type transport system involved in multi-copper enzyme maturation permease subunit